MLKKLPVLTCFFLFVLATNLFAFQARVVKVVDGDTIDVERAKGEGRIRVRYIGIDAPELKEPSFGQEAKRFNQGLVAGKMIRLAFDEERYDRYGRLLAYVWVGSTFVNAELIKAGLATAIGRPPNLKHLSLFLRLEDEARKKKKGIWRSS